jgi:UDP-N-acetylglucosamine 3-dehydrogenase
MKRVCLIGVGRFGLQHLVEWQKLEQAGKVRLAALLVKTEESRQKLAEQYALPVFTQVNDEFFADFDIVDIATPSHTHCQWVERCLPFAHVLVEKPTACTLEELQRIEEARAASQYSLTVMHNYRFAGICVTARCSTQARRNHHAK